MFNKEQRGTLKYTFAHWCAFQMEALNMGVWKWKYLLHDIDKPWLMLCAKILKKDYKWVQKIHRKIRKHHLECSRFDPVATIIDWQCSRYTKSQSPETAREHLERMYGVYDHDRYNLLMDMLNKLNL